MSENFSAPNAAPNSASDRFHRHEEARTDRGVRRVTIRLPRQAADSLDFLMASLPVVAPTTAEAAAVMFRVAVGLFSRTATRQIVDAANAAGIPTTDIIDAAAGLSVLRTPIDDVVRGRISPVRRTPLRTSPIDSSSELAAMADSGFGNTAYAIVANTVTAVAPACLHSALLRVVGASDTPIQTSVDRLSIGLSRAARQESIRRNSAPWHDGIDCALGAYDF